jgi:1-acyl-sn-glycerol-3-phosphate acyltransferase
MRGVFSIIFWTFFGVTCALFFFIAVAIWIVTTPFDRRRRLNHLWSCWWASVYAYWYPGWRVRVTGREKIAPKRPYVLVANHTSIADIVLLFCLFKQFKWVSKTTVFLYPFLGWNMWLSAYVPLKRGDKASIAKMMERCKTWLRRGISVLMFPEGTRSPDGTLKPFKHGAFTMALETGVDVVPIAIHGGHALIPKHGTTFAARADLWVEVLDPIATSAFSDAETYADAVRATLAETLDRERKAEEPKGAAEPEPVEGTP